MASKPKKSTDTWNKRLKQAREEMDLSLSQALKLLYETHKIRWSKSQLSKVEMGKSNCDVDKFKALCDIYCIEPNWILDWEE
jgi:transcriptional regulator with XRE-family HTH domain